MKLRIALVSTCAVLGGLTFGAGNAHAQSVDIDFDGNVTPNCAITAPVKGVLKVSTTPANPAILISNPAEAAGASRGSFTMTCNGGASMVLAVPTVRAGSLAAAGTANYGAILMDGATILATSTKGGAAGTKVVTGPIVNKVYNLDQWVNNGATPLPSGAYLYRVNVAVTAQ
jgi:hypothetical protein